MSLEERRQISLQFVRAVTSHEAVRVVRVMLVSHTGRDVSVASPLPHAAHERQALVAQHVVASSDHICGRQLLERLDEQRTELRVAHPVERLRHQSAVCLQRLDSSAKLSSRLTLGICYNRINLRAYEALVNIS